MNRLQQILPYFRQEDNVYHINEQYVVIFDNQGTKWRINKIEWLKVNQLNFNWKLIADNGAEFLIQPDDKRMKAYALVEITLSDDDGELSAE